MSDTKTQLYIGLTIGPIFQTLEKIKSTRALFSGSYIFSWLMREIIKGVIAEGLSNDQILTPSSNSAGPHPEAGYYADHLIIAAQTGDFEKLLAAKEAVLRKMAAAIASDLNKDSTEVEAYLHRYFQLYCFEYQFNLNDDPFGKINKVLNGLELQKRFPDVDEDWLIHFLNRKQPTFLIKDALGSSARFRSVIEIATGELKRLDEQGYRSIIASELRTDEKEDGRSDVKGDEAVLKKFAAQGSAFKDHLRSYHKYIAVVHADGDGIGKYIGKLGDAEFKAFSDKLFEFSRKAKDKIKEYGGAPIFIGGDDLLFLAPIAEQIIVDNKKQLRTVFNLIQDMDELFQQYFPKAEGNPAISYGISFTYYKYPLNEARSLSYEMERKAKSLRHKNAVAFQLRKHSGATFEAKFSKGQPEYGHFVKLISDLSVEKNFLSSMIHRLGFHTATLEMLLKMPKAEERLKYFFDNNFDEAVHKEEKAFFQRLIGFTQELYRTDPKAALDKLNAALRFIHFLRSTENDE